MAVTPQAGAALYTIFTGDSTLNTAIGGRFYPYRNTPQNTAFPYGSWLQVSAEPMPHMTAATGIIVSTYQVDWISRTYNEARTLAEYARLAADGKPKGAVTIGSDTFTLKMLHLTGEQELHDSLDASESTYFRISQDWRIGFLATVPTF